jgi:hypothetical protein
LGHALERVRPKIRLLKNLGARDAPGGEKVAAQRCWPFLFPFHDTLRSLAID